MKVNAADLYFLSEAYEPEVLPHREEQVQYLQQLFEQFSKTNFAPNVFVRGSTGTGKTGTVRFALNKAERSQYEYVSGNISPTPLKVLRGLTNCSFTAIDKVLSHGLETLRYRRKILIIDEADKVKPQRELFNHLNTLYRGTRAPIIIISNQPQLLKTMPHDAQHTLLFQVLEFSQYDALELQDILRRRIALLGEDVRRAVTEAGVNYIAARAVVDGDGSARNALNVLSQCLQRGTFDESTIRTLFSGVAEEDWVQFYQRLPHSQKKFLIAMIDLYERKGKQGIKAAELQAELPRLLPARISQLITEFEEHHGLIKTRYVNAGRNRGRYRVIEFVSNEAFEILSRVTADDS